MLWQRKATRLEIATNYTEYHFTRLALVRLHPEPVHLPRNTDLGCQRRFVRPPCPACGCVLRPNTTRSACRAIQNGQHDG